MEEKHKKIIEVIKEELSCSSHNFAHTTRVYNLCLLLSKSYGNVDLDVLKVSSLLHDIAKAREDQDSSGETDHALLGSQMAEKILKDLKYEKIDEIKHCIATHRFKGKNKPESLEAKILFDADKLDVIGAIGIARSYMIAGQCGQKMYSDISLEEYIQENLVGGEIGGRIKDTSKHTPNLEFETKIKYIPEKLFTEKAKQVAKKRLAIMKNHFKDLKKEIEGEA